MTIMERGKKRKVNEGLRRGKRSKGKKIERE